MSQDNPSFTERLRSLDLGPIAFTLMHSDDGEGWTKERTALALAKYRDFLDLKFSDRSSEITLTADVKKVWECHVLDTQKYRQDCYNLFGHFLHFEDEGEDNEVEEQAIAGILATIEEQFDRCFDERVGIPPSLPRKNASNL